MKTSLDPRHLRRQKIVQELFAWNEQTQVKSPASSADGQKPKVKNSEIIDPLISNLSQIDEKIVKHAPEWELEKIYHIDLAILRLAIYELTVEKTEPEKVIIDEAVELAKEFGNESSPGFVNGVLGAVIKKGDDRG